MEWKREKFRISTKKKELNIEYIHHFISEKSYWAERVPREIVKKSIQGSVCFGLYDGKKQIGFARVITDKATFGYLADVFVDERYRGKGLGEWLMQVIMLHPKLQGFRNWMLSTKDAHGLYAKVGFKPLETPERIMRINVPDIYKKASRKDTK
ncbi:MAG: GNAT family N-acetyltransferase [Bacteroidetes bacterium]|nr:MAG: GNAT family N-acetyltransferase [Bacteroidota bacterium]